MFKVIYTAFLMLIFTIAPVSFSHALERNTKAEQNAESILVKDDQGFSYELAGNAEEEGALKLFVKNATSKHEIHDITADDLNRITPAAGIKLQFEF